MNEAQLTIVPSGLTQTELYKILIPRVRDLLDSESSFISNCANICSLLYHTLPNINWCGVYTIRGEELILGPFHGKPACTRIPSGRGVCGLAMETRTIQRVDDVLAIKNHIACDSDSRSEIVIPMIFDDQLLGVLDIDSPQISRFTVVDEEYLATIVHAILLSSLSEFYKEIL